MEGGCLVIPRMNIALEKCIAGAFALAGGLFLSGCTTPSKTGEKSFSDKISAARVTSALISPLDFPAISNAKPMFCATVICG